MKNPKSITIVGGGSAGLIAALILKKRLNVDMTLIQSEKIGIIGVGEGSTEHWSEFMQFMDFSFVEILKECDATCKSGIMFKGWAEKDYLHHVNSEYGAQAGQYSFFFARQIANGLDEKDLVSKQSFDSVVNEWFLTSDQCPTYQFHFNTFKLNEFLIKKCKELGIKFIDDVIFDAKLTEDGDIGELIGEKDRYKADFYIDSTGFKKVLIGKLGAKWTSYSKYLKMKSAMVFPTEDTDEYPMWTLSQTMDAGWLFRIPTYGRYGNGYIFDSDYITEDKAKQEIDKIYGKDVEIGKKITFDPGCLDKVWIKNCCAIGLSASFVEPLEASSIGTSIQQAFLLMHRLPNYTDKVIDGYNKDVNDILLNIRDFVALHYITKKDNTQFWKDIQSVEIPDRLKERLEMWKHKLPIKEDFNSESRYVLFTEKHHILVAHGLGLFDKDNIRKEYEMNSADLRAYADKMNADRIYFNETVKTVTHKKYLTILRNKE